MQFTRTGDQKLYFTIREIINDRIGGVHADREWEPAGYMERDKSYIFSPSKYIKIIKSFEVFSLDQWNQPGARTEILENC